MYDDGTVVIVGGGVSVTAGRSCVRARDCVRGRTIIKHLPHAYSTPARRLRSSSRPEMLGVQLRSSRKKIPATIES